MAKTTDLATRYSEISVMLRDVEQAMHQMSWELSSVQKSSGNALSRNHSVIIRGIPEPFMKRGKQGKRAIKYHVVNLFRTVRIPGSVDNKMVLRLVVLQVVPDSGCLDPRLTLREFANPQHRTGL